MENSRFFPEIHGNFCFGCMRLPMKGGSVDYEEFCRMADAFIEAGFNYFDTAHAYLGGLSETVIRDCVAKRYLVGVGGVLAKALAIVMTVAAGVLFFCTSFSGGNAVIVILTATALFWLPELAGVLLAGLVLLQRKIADTFLV